MKHSLLLPIFIVILIGFLGVWVVIRDNIPTPQEEPEEVEIEETPIAQEIQVFFLNEDRYALGTEPYETVVSRSVPASLDPKQTALELLYEGPTAAETSQSLRTVYSETTGARLDFNADTGTAAVYLEGSCDAGGATYNVANLIIRNLEQFPEVARVIIYDPAGETLGSEAEPGHLVPECLQP